MMRGLDALGAGHPKLNATAYLDNRLLRLEEIHFPHLDAYLVSREQLLVRSFLAEHRLWPSFRSATPGAHRMASMFQARPFPGGAEGDFLMTTEPRDVFISYHSDSAKDVVRRIAAALEGAGITCWYAPETAETTTPEPS